LLGGANQPFPLSDYLQTDFFNWNNWHSRYNQS